MLSFIASYFLGEVRHPKLRFFINALIMLAFISFTYKMDYDSGLISNDTSQEAHTKHFYYLYGFYALFLLWQFNKWVINGKVSSVYTMDIECDSCEYIYYGKYHYCPNCNQENFVIAEAKGRKSARRQRRAEASASKASNKAPNPPKKKSGNPNDAAF
ncbi:hypothetical protein O0Q50_22145 [Priestia aryabhattai]|uniref:Uncharacterized protein n=1 Tax=Priestia aryabhattai TaxID=412384 RepID=A0AAX6NEF4_PRIAR|nr:hypothetical protein [Priestia aryabhattai]MDU9693885.1 hypothetical protein [Priestia aryabhattai]